MSRPFQNDQVWEASTTTFRWSSCDLLGPQKRSDESVPAQNGWTLLDLPPRRAVFRLLFHRCKPRSLSIGVTHIIQLCIRCWALFIRRPDWDDEANRKGVLELLPWWMKVEILICFNTSICKNVCLFKYIYIYTYINHIYSIYIYICLTLFLPLFFFHQLR